MANVDSVAMAFFKFPQIHLNLQSPWKKSSHSKNPLFPVVGGRGVEMSCSHVVHHPIPQFIEFENF